MKAYHLNGHAGAGSLVRADVSKPEPANGEVRIRVEAASLNYRDLLILNAAGQGELNGRVPLCDGAGVVEAVGSDVAQWQVGDRVARIVLSRLGLGTVQAQLSSVSPR